MRHRANDPVHPRLRHSTRHANTAPAIVFPLHGDAGLACALAATVATVTCIVAVAPVPVIVTFTGLVEQVLPAGAPVHAKVICPADAPTASAAVDKWRCSRRLRCCSRRPARSTGSRPPSPVTGTLSGALTPLAVTCTVPSCVPVTCGAKVTATVQLAPGRDRHRAGIVGDGEALARRNRDATQRICAGVDQRQRLRRRNRIHSLNSEIDGQVAIASP